MPRISLNKLAEFLIQTNPVRRRSIINDQKNGNPPAAPRYRKAIDPICSFLKHGGDDPEIIYNKIDSLRSETSNSDWIKDDNEKTAQALEHFLSLASQLPLDDSLEYTPGDAQVEKLQLSGVEVSVKPDVIIKGTMRGNNIIGGIKLHFSVDHKKELGDLGSSYVAALLREWLNHNCPNHYKVSYKHCYSIDVFPETVVSSPATYKRLINQAQAACEEITLRWDTI